jgi:hypothetical protein
MGRFDDYCVMRDNEQRWPHVEAKQFDQGVGLCHLEVTWTATWKSLHADRANPSGYDL